MYFYNLDEMTRVPVGVVIKENNVEDDKRFVGRVTHAANIEGEQMHFALVEKLPGTGSKEIHHPNEQFIYVVKGKLKSTVGGEEKIIGPGEAVHIPPNTLHGNVCVSEENCLYITAKGANFSLECMPKGMTEEEFKAREASQQEK